VTQAFKFTGPDPSKALDFSKEITITWTGDIPDNLSPKFNFVWHMKPTDKYEYWSDMTRYVDDVYPKDGEYRYKPSKNTRKELRQWAKYLTKDKLFNYVAVFTNEDGEEVEYASKNYTLTGLN
jgi:hypothetical protein